jgi:hypothetical protein
MLFPKNTNSDIERLIEQVLKGADPFRLLERILDDKNTPEDKAEEIRRILNRTNKED